VNLNKDEWNNFKLAGNFIQILAPKLEDLPKGANKSKLFNLCISLNYTQGAKASTVMSLFQMF
jgi:hypothetical protein